MRVDRSEVARILRRLVRIIGLHLRRDAITAIGTRHYKLTRAVLRFGSWVRDLAIVDQGAHVERRIGYLLDRGVRSLGRALQKRVLV